jgi:hypothetical protein
VVKDTGTPLDSGAIRFLNLPTPVIVRENQHHLPISIKSKGKTLKIVRIDEVWEIDEEWRRDHPIARRYYRVTTDSGRSITIFRDLVGGGWYRQNA